MSDLELPELAAKAAGMKFCVVLPEPPKPKKLRRQARRDGGYDMVPAYTVEEMFSYGDACYAAAIAKAVA